MVSFHQIKENLHLYSKKKIESLFCTLIDAYHSTCPKEEKMSKQYVSLRAENENLNQHLHENVINNFKSTRKEKDIKNNVRMALEENVKVLSNNVHSMIKRNEVLIEELQNTKMELEQNMRWKNSSMLGNIQKSQSSTRQNLQILNP